MLQVVQPCANFLHFPAAPPSDTFLYGSTLLQDRTGFPARFQRYVHRCRQLSDDAVLSSCDVEAGSTLRSVYGLMGGKGGFGSLLRGEARESKGTTNYDACRDLSGRRIRHHTAEAKLAEWREDAKGRELEKARCLGA